MPRTFRISIFFAFVLPLFAIHFLLSTPCAQAYAIKSGDTPGSIAQKNGVTTQELLKANPGLDPKKMRVGQEINIPGAKPQEKAADAKPRQEEKASKKPADEKAKVAEEKAKPAEEKAKPAPAASGGAYTVQKGDTPQSIAAKLGISVPELLKANDNLDPRKLKVGQTLKAPGAAAVKPEKNEAKAEPKAEAKKTEETVQHTVKRGETLAAIASRYGTTIEAIQKLNSAAASGKVKTGVRLKIPAGQAAAPTTRQTPAPSEPEAVAEPVREAGQETPAASPAAPSGATSPEPAAAEPETGTPADAEGYFEKGNELGKQNKYQKAIEQFDRAIKLNPNRADYYASRGHAFYYMKLYTRAVEDYTQAIERNQSFALAYSMRGLSHTRAGHFDKALEDYNKAISLGPKEADYYKGRGYTYFHLKQYGPMCEDYQKACTFGDCELLETARKENLCTKGS
ncbi:LysM peptidoglycan-binding domain-containing protein [Desulfovibrio sulfodismutans]|uniref:LysM peptidoglycan-binding domain-containing protein n=1 Tax=Desulfolutivibrio sulfodismutans TaxID=63561 RepID=A0A7K3NIY6_9BACT|nr:LysM peptidoglycan-binding domain-containing protein [Desulfolutivibrio sulfodismutans]NDY55179.1 LysM peptidoglycan-binding domain-containing protein [Desulfolutivibrio sulfodismutans]QLA12147.1 LysM peptidoglycan-binding domain-containing protein [Desulfolutivibrio sulfodismutans DSM 3696]